MRNSKTIIAVIFLMMNPILCLAQPNDGERVAVYVDASASSYYDLGVYKIVRGAFSDILRSSNGVDVVPDSTASRLAHDYRKSNAIRTGTNQADKKKTTTLYYCTIDIINENVQLSVSAIDIELRVELYNKRNSISSEFFFVHTSECAELLSYRVADSIGLVNNRVLKDKLDSLNRWEAATKDSEQNVRDSEKKKYIALSFLPPVNQFSSQTPKGTANGIAITSGYIVSIGGFIWSSTVYSANKRRYDNVSVDLTEADKARAYYKSQMDICRAGQIASAILFAGTYIYGVANALANRNNYSGTSNVTSTSIAPVAYDNGAGIALVYSF